MKKITTFILLIITGTLFSQFQRSVISNTNTNGAYGILEKDLNGDGHLDLLGASEDDNTLAYFINDGSGNFSQTIIVNNFTGARFIDAADFDNDGDMDFVATGTSELAWFENNGSTFTKHSIATGLNDPRQVRVSDIGTLLDPATPDGDIDIGVLVSGENTATVYLNDGSNSFSRFNIISIDSPRYLHGGDFDLDNSPDFLVSSFNGVLNTTTNDLENIFWYKVGSWGLVQGGVVATNFHGAFGVEGGDIDLDGDDDVIGSAFIDNEVAWFENVNGDGSSFTKHTIDSNLSGASYVHWVDIDNDGDKDIVATGYGDTTGNNSQVVIYYNDGAQNFTKTVIDNNIQGAATFSVQDFNGDGEYDLAVAGSGSNEFVLYIHQSNAVQTNDLARFSVYPNPVYDVLHITSAKPVQQTEVFDITGRQVLSTQQTVIDVSNFNKGYYLVKVILQDGNVITKKVLVLK